MRQRQTIRDAGELEGAPLSSQARCVVQYHATSPTSQARVRLLGELVKSERRYVAKLQILCNSMLPRLSQVQGFDMSIFGEIEKFE